MNNTKHRSPFAIATRLIVLVRPMLPIMLAAIVMGVIGHFCATFITIFGGFALLTAAGLPSPLAGVGTAFVCILAFALLRGVLRYAEQASNHYIAFKLLALIRDQVFGALRRLTPAKLEGRDRGDLISLITPTSHERIRMIAKEAKGFVYCVSSLGVTGVRSEIKTDVAKMVEMVKEVNDIPAAIGFGISTPEQAKKMASVSDGAIVGSAIVKIVAKYGKECIPEVEKYVKEMKAAVEI